MKTSLFSGFWLPRHILKSVVTSLLHEQSRQQLPVLWYESKKKTLSALENKVKMDSCAICRINQKGMMSIHDTSGFEEGWTAPQNKSILSCSNYIASGWCLALLSSSTTCLFYVFFFLKKTIAKCAWKLCFAFDLCICLISPQKRKEKSSGTWCLHIKTEPNPRELF